MKMTLLLLLLATTMSWGADDQSVRPEHSILFWKVDGKGVSGHLLASIPFMDKKSYPLPIVVEKTFAKSSIMILPSNIPRDDEKHMAALTLRKGMYIGEKSLQDDLSSAVFSEMERMLKEFGQGAKAFAKVKPWLVGIAMTSVEINRLGYNPKESLISYFQQKEKSNKTVGLLQYSEWIYLLDGFSREENELFLRMSMQFCRFVRKKHRLFRNSWMRGDLETFEKEFQDQWSGFPDLQDFQQRLDAKSNSLVYGRLDQAMRANPGFFMVFDIEKICGENGLLQWLGKNGYRLRLIR